MKQGIQTNFPHEVLRKEGCYFFCLAEWAARVRGNDFTEDEIIMLFDAAHKAELVKKDVTILLPPQLMNLFLGRHEFNIVDAVNEPPREKRYIIYLEKPGYGHFLLFDNGDIWDPLDPSRPGAVGYKPVSYREII